MEFFNIFEKVSFFDCIRSKTVSGVFHDLKNVKIAGKDRKSVIFANFDIVVDDTF
jgi:hypothetical protein